VSIFIVERTLPGLRLEQLSAMHRAVAQSSHRLSVGGDSVRCLRSMYLPARALCVSVFVATSRDLVSRVNDVAQLPFDSIDEAIAVDDADPAVAGRGPGVAGCPQESRHEPAGTDLSPGR